MKDPNRQKKWTRSRCAALLLAMLMLCQVLLAGCGGRPEVEPAKDSSAEPHVAAQQEQAENPETEPEKDIDHQGSPGKESADPTEAAANPEKPAEGAAYTPETLKTLNTKLNELAERPPVTLPADEAGIESVQLNVEQLQAARTCLDAGAVNAALQLETNDWMWQEFLLLFENRERIQSDNAAFSELDLSILNSINDENMLTMEACFVEAVNELTGAIISQNGVKEIPAVQYYNETAKCVKLAELNELIGQWKEISEDPVLAAENSEDPELTERLEKARAELADMETDFAGILVMEKGELQLEAELADLSERMEELRKELREIRFRNGTLEVFDTVEKHENAIRNLQSSLKELKEEVHTTDENLLLRSVFGFVGLVVAFMALVLGILAIIFAVRKKAAAPAEDAASRTDLDAVSQQCKVYYENQQLKDKKVDELGNECRRLKGVCEDLQEKVRKLESTGAAAVSAPVVKAAPQSAPEQPVGKLHLTYYPIAPDNSYLSADPAGQYAYYRDGRMELAKSELNKGNTLGGWKNNGLMYLFDLEVNGTVYSVDSGALPDGFYHCGEVLRMAEIAAASGGTYKLARKGCIRMQRL